jgi:EAL domain-containing protein (putative c-di-GMP-specific phosphodiesterase class I)
MNVNLSVKQLRYPRVVDDVAEAIAAAGIAPRDLTLEITETVLSNDTDAMIEQLQQLKDLDVKIAIDDFGTGYSSLEYINRFPADSLKIAKPFIDNLSPGGGSDDRLTAAIVRLASACGLATVAEGVEQPAQLERLRQLGCGHAQGYHFARPLEAAAATAALEQAQLTPPPQRPQLTPKANAQLPRIRPVELTSA